MDVTPDQELMLIFGALHLVALVLGGALFVMFLRSESVPEYRPGDEEEPGGEGGGGNDRTSGPPKQPPRPGGGLPLPDAVPAAARLRSHEKLRDVRRARDRRPAREPSRRPIRVGP